MLKNIQFYKDYYEIPTLCLEESVDSFFLNKIKNKHHFAIIGIYNTNKKVLLIRDLNKNIGWEIPGGFIKEGESPEHAAHRIALNETGINIDELFPLAIVKNVFKSGNKSVIHEGVAFMALSRDKIKSFPENYSHIFTDKCFEKIAYQNESVFKLIIDKLKEKNIDIPFNEIESLKISKIKRVFDRFIIKNISKLSSKKIFNKIENLIDEKSKTILDASCGDSSNIICLNAKFKDSLCVGNDICWKSILSIKNNNDVIFTNHDIINLPFKKKFDTILFKNTLHHIPKEHQKNLIGRLSRMCKQLIVIDINDPRNHSLISKIWNRYYVWFLNDQGETFLNSKSFKKLVENSVEDSNIEFGDIQTIKGEYMFANIKNNE